MCAIKLKAQVFILKNGQHYQAQKLLPSWSLGKNFLKAGNGADVSRKKFASPILFSTVKKYFERRVYMARVTVEDCTAVVKKFMLVLVAAERVREISAGSPITVSRDNDKNTVIALREVAAGHLDVDVLQENIIQRFQRFTTTEIIDAPEDMDLSEMMSQEVMGMGAAVQASEFDDMVEDSMIEISEDEITDEE
jgi:DNA-directed RNA polymerase subunit omega